MDPRNQYQQDYRTSAHPLDQPGAYGAEAGLVVGASPAVRGAFLRKVYATLTAGVGITMAVGLFMVLQAAGNENSILWKIVQGRGMMMLFLAYLALAFMMGAVVRQRGINVIAYVFFTAFTGFFISPMLLIAAAKTGSFAVIWQALGLTTFAFGGLTGYVLVSGKDFSFMRGFIWTGFWILVGFMVIGLFTSSWAFHMGVTAAGLLVFAGFVLYDTSEIMHRYGPEDWVAGAFSLFIDFINMFIRVLALLSNRR